MNQQHNFIQNTIRIFSLLLVVLFFTNCNKENTQPNIILFFVDDLGWQDTSVPFWKEKTPLNKLYQTPNMERLANEGMKFTQAYATPVCSPTRISLMTGMNAARHRVTNWTLRKDAIQPMEKNHPDLSFPKWNVNGLSMDTTIDFAVHATPFPFVLQQNNYKTIHVVKAHLGAIDTPGENPLNLGFDVNIAGHAAGAPKSYYGKDNFGNLEKFQNSPWPVPGVEEYHGKDIFLTEALTQKAIKAIDQPIHDNQPFFLYMSLYGVHTPIMGDERFLQKYLDQGIDSTEAKYASMVEAMDKSLGDLMNHLEEKNISKNTIILFMSDNGGLSAVARGGEKHTHNKPLSSGKGAIHEGGVREPMIVKWNGVVSPNSVNDDYLIIEDFYPTILEMAGIKDYQTLQQIDGQSFVSFLTNKNLSKKSRPLYWHYPNEWGPTGPGIGAFSAIRLEDWKLIYYHRNQTFELFNIQNDIGEQINLFEKEKKRAKDLATLLTDYLKSVDAQMPSFKMTNKIIPFPIEAIKD